MPLLQRILGVIALVCIATLAIVLTIESQKDRKKQDKLRKQEQELMDRRQEANKTAADFARSVTFSDHSIYIPGGQLAISQLLVEKIDPNGAAATCYGLQVGDIVKSDELLKIDAESVTWSYMHGESLKVERNGKTITLPEPGRTPKFPTPPPFEPPSFPQHVPIS